MFTKDQIDNFIKIYESGDNKLDDYFKEDSLKATLVEAKMLVDRWDNFSTDIIVHSSHKDLFKKTFSLTNSSANEVTEEDVNKIEGFLGKEHKVSQSLRYLVSKFGKPLDSVWGANIHYSDNCPVDHGIILSLTSDGKLFTRENETEEQGRSVAVFPVK